eukprot:3340832-Rhodomonas_salina.1
MYHKQIVTMLADNISKSRADRRKKKLSDGRTSSLGEAPRELERISDVLVRRALVLRHRAMHKVGDAVHKDHDVFLQALGAVREGADVAEAKHALQSLAGDQRVHFAPAVEVLGDDRRACFAERDLEHRRQLDQCGRDRLGLAVGVDRSAGSMVGGVSVGS